MRAAIASLLLAASSALATPLTARYEQVMWVGDMVAHVSASSHETSFDFTLGDCTKGWDQEIKSYCRLRLNPDGSSKGEDVCGSDNYRVRLFGVTRHLNNFTLEVDRLVEPAWTGHQHFVEGGKFENLGCDDGSPVSTCTSAPNTIYGMVVVEDEDEERSTPVAVSARDEPEENSMIISNLAARVSVETHYGEYTYDFDLTDRTGGETRQTHCTLALNPMGPTERDDVCDNDYYLVRLAGPNRYTLSNFTLEVERVAEPGWKARAQFIEGSGPGDLHCVDGLPESTCSTVPDYGVAADPVIELDPPSGGEPEENYMVIGDVVSSLSANVRGASFAFDLTDRTAGKTTQTYCKLYQNPNGGPEREDVCESDNYRVRLYGVNRSIKKFTLEVERIAEPDWKGRAHFEEGDDHLNLHCVTETPVTSCSTTIGYGVRLIEVDDSTVSTGKSGVDADPVIELDDPPTKLSTRSDSETESTMNLYDLVWRSSSTSRESRVEFKLQDDADYPDIGKVHFCELGWGPMGPPAEDACDSDAYLVRFVDDSSSTSFTLEVERVKEPKSKGRVHYEMGTPQRYYGCIDGPGASACVATVGQVLEPVEK